MRPRLISFGREYRPPPQPTAVRGLRRGGYHR